MRFGTNPEIGIQHAHKRPGSAMKTVRGWNPAGALERYDAVKRSLARMRPRNSAVRTELLKSAISGKASGRTGGSTDVHDLVDRNEAMTDEKERRMFLD